MFLIELQYWNGNKLVKVDITENTYVDYKRMKDVGKNRFRYIERQLNNGKDFIVISDENFWQIINKRKIYRLGVKSNFSEEELISSEWDF